MKSFRTVLSLLMVAVLLVGFLVVPGSATDTPPMGDVSGDGKLNLGDVTRIYSHIRNVRLITDEQALGRADLTGDGKLNIGDVARLYSQIRNGVGIETNVTLKVWAPYEDQQEDNSWLLAMEESFQKKHPEYNITWVNAECSEGDVSWLMEDDPESAADVYLFANDQMGFLKDINALSPLRGKYLEQVIADNSQILVDTVTFTDNQVYGFPIANNTWFMYYNKNVFSEEDVKSLDTMLTKGRVAFPWDAPWYSGTFFLANGGQIFGEKGNDAAAGIQFGVNNGGYEATLKMMELAAHPNFLEDINGLGWSGMVDGTVDAYFSGSWDHASLKEFLGDALGAVQPPMVEIDGQQKQMMAFAGSKAVGVNPAADHQTAAMEFAAHLASAEGQKLRYELRGIIPAAEAFADDPEINADPVAMAERNTMSNAAVVQPTIVEMSNYWAPVATFGGNVVNGYVDAENYAQEVDQLMWALNTFDPYEPEDPDLPDYPDLPELPEGSDELLPPPADGTPITLKVWAPWEDQMEDRNWLVRMENQFQQEHPQYSITWINEICNEGDAGYIVDDDPQGAADVYMFPNDQLESLKYAGALTALGGEYLDQVRNDNAQVLVNTVTAMDDQVYGFPITNNTWFMYYNKDVFSEEDVQSLDTMLTKGKVAFPWGTAWYGGTFFLANGGQLFGEKGNDASAGIQFGQNNGGYEAALKMIQLANHPNMEDDCNGLGASGLREGIIDAYFSGSWDYAYLKECLGDALGAVQPPMVEIDGQQKQMMAFAGSKAVGVNPYTDHQAVAMEFAAHLASVEGQKLRYQVRGVIPAAKALAEDPLVSANSAAVAEINTMNNASVVQPAIPEMSSYWMPVGNFGAGIVCGEINESNYMAYVDQMMSYFGNSEPAEEHEIANIQYSNFGDIGDTITLRIHYNRPDENYEGWNVWLWDSGMNTATLLEPPYEFEQIDGEMVCTVELNSCTNEVGYLIRLGDWEDKDIYEDQFIDLSNIICGTVDVYIESGIYGYTMEWGDDVICGDIPNSLNYKHSKQQLIFGLTAVPMEDPILTLSGSDGSIAITKLTRAENYYYLTLEQPLAPGQYTLTCDTGLEYTIVFDII
jgi:arabinogalactan oligomer/maltooligosaccharide transport system substrate-binding protein